MSDVLKNYRWVLLLILALISCYPILPVFVKLFLPFPELKDAQVITGTIEVEGEWHLTRSGSLPARYYVVNTSGRHEIYCGLPGKRNSCFFSDNWIQGAEGTVWFDPIFGVVQWKGILNKEPSKGRIDEELYAGHKKFFENYFEYGWYLNFKNTLPILIFLIAAIYEYAKYYDRKQSKTNSGTAS